MTRNDGQCHVDETNMYTKATELVSTNSLHTAYRHSICIIIVGFFILVSSLKVFGHSIHSERRRIYPGKSIQALQNDTIII